ncbi:telomeric repeat-binding factor 2-interacting protein 1-like isoform X2 [Pyxicephalus adspersus]|uniref:telomeric repeat-binding factor 2-interacting protein 1-like isoform X2 n=1 Tax=Pyxicephalus adspersus TaxID=30357 RepID=UPI003B5B5144
MKCADNAPHCIQPVRMSFPLHLTMAPPLESEDLQIFKIGSLSFEITKRTQSFVPTQKSSMEDVVVIEDSDGEPNVESEDCPLTEAPPPTFNLQDLPVIEVSDSDSEPQLDVTPPGSPAVGGLQEAMMDIMREFNLSLYRTTQCLFFNSGEVDSARHFLRTGLRPDGYPIWEPKDDADLTKNNANLRGALLQKYGEKNVTRRLEFLES